MIAHCSSRRADRRTHATMGHNDIWASHPANYGKGSRRCRVCENQWAIIRKYDLNICRQCFREYAKDIGFVKNN